MSWASLLAKHRFSGTAAPSEAPPTEHQITRVSTFQEDIDRICYSAAFRRLQGKTQVLPFPRSDFTRTRLTHTIDVANVGRQISSCLLHECKDQLAADGLLSTPFGSDLSDVVIAACFAHDLGNPAFGHLGEYVIQHWFSNQCARSDEWIGQFSTRSAAAPAKEVEREELKRQTHDLLYFDGNAQGFRVLTRLQGWRNAGGLQLSAAVLATYSKYPYSSLHATQARKKYGFMHSESDYAREVFERTGLIEIEKGRFCRHPLAFIVEAADDITYHVTDIEDAFKDGVLSFAEASILLKEIAESGQQLVRYDNLVSRAYSDADRIAYLRSGAVSALIFHVAKIFAARYQEIMTGANVPELIDQVPCSAAITTMRDVTRDKIYRQRAKTEMEAMGCIVIERLLDEFFGVIKQFSLAPDKMSVKQQKLYDLLPHDNKITIPTKPYEGVQYLFDFVSSMSDRYALDLYRKLMGMNVPHYPY